jgi:putative sporulation protein YtxC
MENFYIIPGTYTQVLQENFKDKILILEKGDSWKISAEPELLAEVLCAFIEEHYLYKEVQRHFPRASQQHFTEAFRRIAQKNRRKVAQLLREFLREHPTIHIEGFLRFRLRTVLSEMCYGMQLSLREIQQEEQYRYFLMLLQTYVKDCDPLVDTVLLLADGTGQHHIFTETGIEITYDYADLEDVDVLENEDDVILSSLLTIAPRTVYLYGQDRSANPCLVDTIRKIFSVREIG